uniref:Olfactory receptor n=1 Tax=Sus scrofa TaxID=9823 RepID=A0A8W4F8C9_PIG
MKQRSRKVRWNHSSFMQRGKREKSSRAPFLEAGERTKLLSMSIRNDQGQLEMYRMTLFLTKEYSHFPQQEQPTGEMEAGNHSSVTEFILLGLTEDPVLGVICFVIFLGIYVVTLVGNVSIILLIKSCPQLHTPMYLFLGHLASVDSGISTSVTPVMLRGLLRHGVAITTAGCEAQLLSVVFFGTTDGFLLATMAYDRYVAICMPLLYSTHMSPRVCVLLLGASYLGGCVNASLFTSCLLSLSFCGPNQIDHFFCDFSSLLKLSCSDVSILEIIPSISSGSILVVTGFVIVLSYIYILFTILKMPSTEGRHKAFSTCTSHITAVTLYYGSITFIYVMPKSSYSTDQNKVVSVFYSVVIPMLNPLIYSLRNRDVKEALRKTTLRVSQ